jgi:hypothetical protein
VPASKHRSDWEAGVQVKATSSGQIACCQATRMAAGCACDRRKSAFMRPIPTAVDFESAETIFAWQRADHKKSGWGIFS